MKSFSVKILKIGINPYVLLPDDTLNYLFKKAGKDKGYIPVYIIVNRQRFIQHLVKYSGKWRLYLNTPMRKVADKDVGDMIDIKIDYDDQERITPMHPKLREALDKNMQAKEVFDKLSPYRRKEIQRYLNNLKTEESLNKNIQRAINSLMGKESFVGRHDV